MSRLCLNPDLRSTGGMTKWQGPWQAAGAAAARNPAMPRILRTNSTWRRSSSHSDNLEAWIRVAREDQDTGTTDSTGMATAAASPSECFSTTLQGGTNMTVQQTWKLAAMLGSCAAVAMSAGCATKGFVREQVASSESRMQPPTEEARQKAQSAYTLAQDVDERTRAAQLDAQRAVDLAP